jgi:tRNA pseudouridine32 synthase/23S rRNA pseudouridine746 synthase
MSTSGLLLMARGGVAQRSLNAAFASRLIHKRYEAVVQGVVSMTEGISETAWQEINLPIFLDWPQRPKRMIDVERGQTSKTRWRALSSNSTAQTSRLLLEPITGRSHQLRVHLCAIAHPILGDTLYAPPEVAALSERLLLHATELTLVHPISQKTLHFESAAPF